MGRASLVIDEKALKEEIHKAESSNTFENQARLFEYICRTPWAATIKDTLGRPRTLSPANVYQRVIEFNIPLKTSKGKKGGGVRGAVRKARGESSNKTDLLKTVPEKFHPLVKKAANGSLIAKVKLKCLDCCCWQRSEVLTCKDKDCPLWDAFKRKEGKADEDIED